MKKQISGDLRTVDFLSNFESETRAQIIEFGKRISSIELASDVFLIMARKAICFVDLLIKFDLVRLNGIIVTDRILDTNIQWLKDKTITIIDDALVSGTTIRKTIDKLKTVVNENNIKVFVLSVNNDWYKRNDIEKNSYEMLVRTNSDGHIQFDKDGQPKTYLIKPLNYQTNEKCMRTCFDIVKSISKVPRPYDIDFPFYEDWYIDEKKLNNLFNSSWFPVKVTSVEYTSDKYTKRYDTFMSVDTKCDSITFYPQQSTVEKLSKVFGLNLFSKGTLKIRTYIRERKKVRSNYHISFLPIVIINELSYDDIDSTIMKISKRTDIPYDTISNIFNTYSSKFRLIQYILSCILAREFFVNNKIYNLNVSTGYPIFPALSYERLGYIFPTIANPIIRKLIENLYPIETIILNSEYPIKQIPVNELAKANPLMAFERLSDRFLNIYKEKELKARTLAKDYGYQVFADDNYKEIINRLDVGLTFNDLLKTHIPLNDANNEEEIQKIPNAEYIVSTFLDYSIDCGAVVPIIFSHDNKVSRAYRHGEDVIFSDEEARLLAYMLYIFAETANLNSGMGGLLAEKLFSSFIRLGLGKKIFNKYDYSQINNNFHEFLKICYNLHGSTVRLYDEKKLNEEPKTYITDDDKSKWLWEVLDDKKLIKATIKKRSSLSHIITFPEDTISYVKQVSQNQRGIAAERIAETLGYCYKNRLLNAEDLILLNATYGYEEIIPALLAEIEIIRTDNFIKNDFSLRQMFNRWHIMNFLQSSRNSKAFIAMNSGKLKYEKFLERFARNKITEINNELQSKAPREISRNWTDMWQEQLENVDSDQPDETVAIFFKEANCVLQYGLIYRLFEYLAFQKTIGEDSIWHYFNGLRQYIVTIEKNEAKKYVKEKNEENSNFNAYFKISNVDKLTLENIFNDEFICKLAKAEYIKKDIINYINKLKEINNVKLFSNATNLIENAEKLLDSSNFEQKNLDYLISHIQQLDSAVSILQEEANRIINNHGKIEKSTDFNNAIIIQFSNKNSTYLRQAIIQCVGKRRAKIKNSDVELYNFDIENGIAIFARGNKTDESLSLLIRELNKTLNINNELELYAFLNIDRLNRPYKFKNSRLNKNHFLVYARQCIDTLSKGRYALCVITQLNDKTYYKNKNEVEYKMYFDNKYYKVQAITKENNLNKIIKNGFTIGIICAKPTELDGVKQSIMKKYSVVFDDTLDEKENYRRILTTEIILNKSDYQICHKIVLTLCEQGNIGSALAYDSLAHFKMDYIFFCGIAGSCDKNVKIGDVFIPFTIINMSLKKVLDNEIQVRSDAYKIPAHHKGIIEQFIYNSNYQFKIYNECAMSDNAVIACTDNEYLRSVRTVNDKALACIEMESAGLFDEDYNRHKTKYGVYSIRGISDKANAQKDDTYHEKAIQNVSLVMADLLDYLFNKIDIIKKIKP